MRLRIHHGAVQVGGNCVELESAGKRLLLDLGLPLDSEPHVPNVSGLLNRDANLLGVVLSHPHLDHYGLLPLVRSDVPVWLGEDAKRLLDAAAPFTPAGSLPQVVTGYRANQAFDVGPFHISPYLMDHSAYDAYALLVEAGGRRLFYSGDFRGHGRKATVFEQFLRTPPRNIDLLLMEGTTLGRDEESVTESDVEAQAQGLMKDTPGIVLACFSAQNIDRFVSFFRASVRSGRTFVVDAYLAHLLSSLGLKSLPDPADGKGVRVFLPSSQKRRIVRSRRFDLIDAYRHSRIYKEEIGASPRRFTMLFRASMARDFAGVCLRGGALVYSLWPGYLDRDRTDLRRWASDRGLGFHIVHSSGHAHPSDLLRMAEAIRPRRLMPIHTARPDVYGALYPTVQGAANGEWVEV